MGEILLHHKIKECLLEDIKNYFQPKVFEEYCKACPHYDRIWSCPPYGFPVEEVVEGYKYAYIIGSKLYPHEVEEDIIKPIENKDLNLVSNRLFKIARIRLDEELIAMEHQSPQVKVLLAGRCLRCDSCAKVEGQPCLHPENLHYSLESIGFDVASICDKVLGEKILWAKDQLPEYFLLVSAILSKEKIDLNKIKLS